MNTFFRPQNIFKNKLEFVLRFLHIIRIFYTFSSQKSKSVIVRAWEIETHVTITRWALTDRGRFLNFQFTFNWSKKTIDFTLNPGPGRYYRTGN